LVSFLFAVLVLMAPPAQPFLKVGGGMFPLCPMELAPLDSQTVAIVEEKHLSSGRLAFPRSRTVERKRTSLRGSCCFVERNDIMMPALDPC